MSSREQPGHDPFGSDVKFPRPSGSLPFYALYIGSRGGAEFDGTNRDEVFDLVSARFPSFSAFDAHGFYKGARLPTLVVHIATKDRHSISELCQELGRLLRQRWIGVSDGGTYRSIEILPLSVLLNHPDTDTLMARK